MTSEKIQKGPLMLSFDVTYRCTLKCLHCFNLSNEQSFEKELTDEELLDICSTQILEVEPAVICFCGGEPLLRRNVLYECCNTLVTKSNKNITVNMVTNGELLTEDVAQNLKKANFSQIQVSIDGASSITHDWLRNKQGAFDNAIRAIKNLKEVGLSVGVAFTPTKKNMNEIEKTVIMCNNLGVNSFRVQPLMPMGRAINNLSDYLPQYEDYRSMVNYINKVKFKNVTSNKIMVEWGDPVDHLIRSRFRNNGYTPFFGINAYGYITVSPYLPLTVGNVKNHSIYDYWNKGLSHIWGYPLILKMSGLVKSSDILGFSKKNLGMPRTYYEQGLNIDLIDSEKDLYDIKEA